MKKNQNRACQGWKTGLIVSGVSTAVLLFVNRRSREKIVNGTKQTASTVNEASTFLANNREEIITKVKSTSNELSELLKSASNDIQYITNKANHLKETSLNVKEKTKQTADEIKELKHEKKEDAIPLNRADNVEHLPTRNNLS